MKCMLLVLAVALCNAPQALAKPPILILPGLLDARLFATYNATLDTSGACTSGKIINKEMWVPKLQNATDIADFLATFSPAPGCWYYNMQLRALADGTFTSNLGVTVTPSLSISESYILPALRRLLLTKTGLNYDAKLVRVLPYDWRLDTNSLNKTHQLAVLRAHIVAAQTYFGEKVILLGYSQGNMVAMALLKDPAVRAAVKGYIAVAPPFGGSSGVIGAMASGAVKGNIAPAVLAKLVIPPPYNTFLTREDLMWNAAINLASLAMLAPTAAGYSGDAVIAVAAGKQYTVSQLTALLEAIGQAKLESALSSQLQASDFKPIDGVTTYCIYGSGVKTPTKLVFKSALVATKNDLPTVGATAAGDGVVPLTSASLCDKLTDAGKVSNLVDAVGHFNILAKASAQAAISAAITALVAAK